MHMYVLTHLTKVYGNNRKAMKTHAFHHFICISSPVTSFFFQIKGRKDHTKEPQILYNFAIMIPYAKMARFGRASTCFSARFLPVFEMHYDMHLTEQNFLLFRNCKYLVFKLLSHALNEPFSHRYHCSFIKEVSKCIREVVECSTLYSAENGFANF